jgi:hypothetical protein
MILFANAAPKVPLVSAVTNAPVNIELKDQFDSPQVLSFPTTNLIVLTIADHKGSEQIAGWVAPVKQRYGLRVDIRGIADMSAVPGWLRGVVRKRFQQRQVYPVMLDWSGDVVKAFAAVNETVNVFVLDERGWILKRFAGEARPRDLEEMYATIDHALAGNKPPGATK